MNLDTEGRRGVVRTERQRSVLEYVANACRANPGTRYVAWQLFPDPDDSAHRAHRRIFATLARRGAFEAEGLDCDTVPGSTGGPYVCFPRNRKGG